MTKHHNQHWNCQCHQDEGVGKDGEGGFSRKGGCNRVCPGSEYLLPAGPSLAPMIFHLLPKPVCQRLTDWFIGKTFWQCKSVSHDVSGKTKRKGLQTFKGRTRQEIIDVKLNKPNNVEACVCTWNKHLNVQKGTIPWELWRCSNQWEDDTGGKSCSTLTGPLCHHYVLVVVSVTK